MTHATFKRRRTLLPDGVPFGLSDEFAAGRQKQIQWQAFLRKNALDELQLSKVVADLRACLSFPAGRAPARCCISANIACRKWVDERKELEAVL